MNGPYAAGADVDVASAQEPFLAAAEDQKYDLHTSFVCSRSSLLAQYIFQRVGSSASLSLPHQPHTPHPTRGKPLPSDLIFMTLNSCSLRSRVQDVWNLRLLQLPPGEGQFVSVSP
jgi:hypothetical protein